MDALGLESYSLVLHDWGAVGLELARRHPERVERLVLLSTVPLVPGYRWHRVARGWRRPLVGELMMGVATRWAFRRELPAALADPAWEQFDHGTQRAILKLYRSAPSEVLARAGEGLDRVRARRSCSGPPPIPTSDRSSASSRPRRWAVRWSSRWWSAGTGSGRTGPTWWTAWRTFWALRSASLSVRCSGPRSPQSRRLLAVARARSRPAPASRGKGTFPNARRCTAGSTGGAGRR